MAKKKVDKYKQYETEITTVIKAQNLFVITDIFAFYSGLQRSQFYNLKLDKSDTIIKAIDDNKVKTKQSLKGKWFKSENATLQIALFKTICNDDEAARLNTQRHDVTQQTEQPFFELPKIKKE